MWRERKRSLCVIPAMPLKSSKTFTAQIAASFQAFMPSHLLPHWDQLWLFVLLDLLLNYPSIILILPNPPLTCTRSTLQAVVPPASQRRFHLSLLTTSSGPEISSSSSSTAPLCTATLRSRPLPAARLLIGIGGEEQIAVRHGRPLEPTKPGQGHSHHSCATASHSKQGDGERARDAGVKGKREIRLPLSEAPQSNEVSRKEENASQ